MVLGDKERHGATVTKHYDAPQTPYQRVLDSPEVSAADKEQLRQLYLTLNPAALWRQIQAQQKAVWSP